MLAKLFLIYLGSAAVSGGVFTGYWAVMELKGWRRNRLKEELENLKEDYENLLSGKGKY